MPDAEDLPDDPESGPSGRPVTLDAEAILRKLGGPTQGPATPARPSEFPASDPAFRADIAIPGGSTYAVAATVPVGEDDDPPSATPPVGAGRADDRPATPEEGRGGTARGGASRAFADPGTTPPDLLGDSPIPQPRIEPAEASDARIGELPGAGSPGERGRAYENPGIPASPTIAFRDAFPSAPMIDGIRAGSGRGESRDDVPEFGAGGASRSGMPDDFPGSRHGVSAEDLLKTNELLRQLVEEMKRQRVASLPAAGPSVYPGR